MSHDSSSSRSNYFDSSFDYRSLLPQGMLGGSNNSNQQILLDPHDTDIESGSSSSSSSSLLSRSGCAELCGSWMPEMTWKERMIGCGTCMIAGYLLSLGSFFRIRDLLFGNPVPLVLNATIGNMIALAGSCFLSGPTNQLNRMWTPKRRNATILYLSSLLLTLIIIAIPLPGPKGIILLLLMFSQYISITWYCLSYIPMGQEMVAGYFKRWITINVNGNDGEY